MWEYHPVLSYGDHANVHSWMYQSEKQSKIVEKIQKFKILRLVNTVIHA